MAQATYTSNLDAILEAMKAGIEAGVSEAVEKVAAKARQLCPVGTVTKGTRSFFYARTLKYNRAKWKKRKELAENGQKWELNSQGKRTRKDTNNGSGWTARRPGTLRDSIFTRVRWKDGTCLGWVKAGAEGSPDGSAYYAPFVEFGTSRKNDKAQPFMRPALRSVDLTDIAMAIGLEIGQTTRRGMKKKTYGA